MICNVGLALKELRGLCTAVAQGPSLLGAAACNS